MTTAWRLAAAGLGGLLVIGAGLDLALGPRRHHNRRAGQRLAALAARHARRPAVVLRAGRARLSASRQGPALLHRFAHVVGYDPVLADRYAVPWWIVLPAALLLARLVAALFMLLFGPAAIVFVPFGWAMFCRSAFHILGARHTGRLLAQFPDALAMIVRAVRVGIPVAEGVAMVAREAPQPTAAAFAHVSSRLAMGVTIDEALRDMADRNRLAEYRFFATALALQSQTGGGLTETLENLADVIRRRVAMRARGHALAAEARMSIYVLGALPFIAGGALYLLRPEYVEPLVYDPGGRKVLAAAILTLATGLWAMQTIIRRTLA